MKDFYSTLTDTKTPNTGTVRFMHVLIRGKPQEETYDFLSIGGTREEFAAWAKREFGYLKIQII